MWKQTKIICLKEIGAISTLSVKPLKFADSFTYLRSIMSSTERDVNIHIGKAWTAIDRFSIMQESDLSDKIKMDFF